MQFIINGIKSDVQENDLTALKIFNKKFIKDSKAEIFIYKKSQSKKFQKYRSVNPFILRRIIIKCSIFYLNTIYTKNRFFMFYQ